MMAGDPIQGYYLEKIEIIPMYHTDGSGTSYARLKTFKKRTNHEKR